MRSKSMIVLQKVYRKRIFIASVLLGIWFASSWALFRPGFFQVHDYVHAARFAELGRALLDGHFPVRWSQNFGNGYGMPLFEFYAPLPYYLGGVLWLMGVPMITVLKLLWGLCSAVTLVGAYSFGSVWSKRSGGLVAAAALTLAPYRAVNLYIRGALGEAWGIAFMPWLLFGTILVVRGKKWGWLITAISFTFLCLSHNLMTMTFAPLSLVFALGMLAIERPKAWMQRVVTLGASFSLGLGLAAFYLGPAFLEKHFTKVDQIIGGYFDYHLHFLYIRQLITPGWGYGGSTWGPDDGLSFFLGWGQWLGVILSIILFGRCFEVTSTMWKRIATKPLSIWTIFIQSLKKKASPVLTYGFVAGLWGVSLFMTLGKSTQIWELVSPLQYAQFPWRWLGSASVFMSLILALSVSWIVRPRQRYAFAVLLIVVTMIGNWSYFQPETRLPNPDGLYAYSPSHIRTELSQVLNDYVPIQMPGPLEIEPAAYVAALGTEKLTTAQILRDTVAKKSVQVQLTTPQLLTWAISDFPGWRVVIDGQLVSTTRDEVGLLAVQVPAGDHTVTAEWGSTPVRKISDTLSLLSLGILGISTVMAKKKSTV